MALYPYLKTDDIEVRAAKRNKKRAWNLLLGWLLKGRVLHIKKKSTLFGVALRKADVFKARLNNGSPDLAEREGKKEGKKAGDDQSTAVLHSSLSLRQGSYSHSDAAVRNQHSCFPSRDTSNFHSHLLCLQTHTHERTRTHKQHLLTGSQHKLTRKT